MHRVNRIMKIEVIKATQLVVCLLFLNSQAESVDNSGWEGGGRGDHYYCGLIYIVCVGPLNLMWYLLLINI